MTYNPIRSIREWLNRVTGRQIAEEDWNRTSGKVTWERDAMLTDAHGFQYVRYRLTDVYGNRRTGYCRVIPTTYPFSCPDCGGMVVGADARRVTPGGKGPMPTLFVCEGCGRREDREFGVPRIEYREGALTFEEPRGAKVT